MGYKFEYFNYVFTKKCFTKYSNALLLLIRLSYKIFLIKFLLQFLF